MKVAIAYGMLALVAMIWGGGFIATSHALDTFSPFTILAIRFLLASIIPFFIVRKKGITIGKKDCFIGGVGGCLLFFAFALQTIGLQTTTASKNAFLTATNVIFVPFLMHLCFQQKMQKKQWFMALLCCIGIATLTLDDGSISFVIGDVYSFLCAILFAFHFIWLDRYSKQIDTWCFIFLQLLVAGIFSLVCCVMTEDIPAFISMDAIVSILFLAFGSTMFAYILQTYAQTIVSATTASMILSLESVWASVFSFFFLQETMTPMMLFGAGCILASILYSEMNTSFSTDSNKSI